MTGENSEIPKLGRNIFSIIATGDSAKDWVPNGHSIGVNDVEKFGRPVNSLLICNRPQQFSADRLKIITESKPKDFYSHKSNWKEYFPLWKKVRLHTWNGTLQDWHRSDGPSAYSSNTSPLIAITLAYNLGAKDIILWGVDFLSHSTYHSGNPDTKREVDVYRQVFRALLEMYGVNVWLGKNGSVFDDTLKVYSPLAKEIQVLEDLREMHLKMSEFACVQVDSMYYRKLDYELSERYIKRAANED